MRVITYQAPGTYSRISLTPEQVERLRAADRWPRHWTGVEYCDVHYGLHEGEPTWDDGELDREVGLAGE